MEWWVILLLVLAVPVILIPVGLIWYINVSGIYTVIRETQRRRAEHSKRVRETQLASKPVLK
ncbi:MAG: hypothetical protein JSW16_01480 [Dehalococcoidales bacterium]|nr:MAG: hypothetical protein JSW16_01480 [Dehalococcoidales bacterium]